MSFKSDNVYPSVAQFTPIQQPDSLLDGAMWYDIDQQQFMGFINGLVQAIGSGGGGTPAGITGDMQFNSSGVFGNANSVVPGASFIIGAEAASISVPTRLHILASGGQLNIESSAPQGTALNAIGDISLDSSAGSVIVISETGSVTFEADLGFIGFTTPVVSFSQGVNAAGLQVFASNADAISGGLGVGDFYRTGADPDTVCVVH